MTDEYLNSNPDDDNFDIDKALDEIDEPITQPDDLWLLGQHRLLCGDLKIPFGGVKRWRD
ncbi:hypothetical protein [Marininema mesophilum]|uniref:hypothetical protein n=1 Tax=Marininema mesophilum TaxID=1048340 RepID=UPI0015A71357|nr:hypothetical protein [Marininema mesophilum]